MDVQKNEEKGRLRGAGWHQLVERNHFVGAEMLVFSMGAQPKILVVMFNDFGNEEEEEEDRTFLPLGDRAFSLGHHLRKKEGNQVASSARFHRRMDGNAMCRTT